MPGFDTDTGRILFLGGMAAMMALLVLSAPAARALRGAVGIRRVGLLLYGCAATPLAAGGLVIGGILPEGTWIIWLMIAAFMVWGFSLVGLAAVAFLRGSPEPAVETPTIEAPASPEQSPPVHAPIDKPPRAREIADNPVLAESEVKIRCASCGKKMRAAGAKFAKQRRCPNCKASPFRFILEPSDAPADQPTQDSIA